MFYYPLFLWWILTAVIPLRPREFLVLERNCLSIKNGKYYLRLRRNQLKGGRQAISYKLEKDYRIDVIAVPDKVGREFETYIRLTENFPSTEINTLFRTDPHYRRWKRATPEDSRFLTYENMRTILRYFYDEVLKLPTQQIRRKAFLSIEFTQKNDPNQQIKIADIPERPASSS